MNIFLTRQINKTFDIINMIINKNINGRRKINVYPFVYWKPLNAGIFQIQK